MNATRALAALLFAVCGCASPPHGTYFSSPAESVPDLGAVHILRPSHSHPLAVNPWVEINGVEVVELPREAYTFLHLRPGTYEISTHWPIDGPVLSRTTTLNVAAGKSYYVDVSGPWALLDRSPPGRTRFRRSLSEPPQIDRPYTLVAPRQVEVLPQLR